ncbi:HepT-like ribonuclease domain-containing protein [Alkaliphilus serpentinus]|uniref:DUF86 domain-containing protein n=1 Tax=Alkaliphilus serpentinus TaxID=1482731 RepID=A0A833HPA6_9FIRM|nr:HepT-like ribonuclease domain-containing protein [Alkaliphilus serpentinus]KAB3530521.1 DUF86 domain-containing protein [Alkaliphilus serpentinus]
MKILLNNLDKLEEYAEILSTAASYTKMDFLETPLVYGGAERFILMGYQNILESCYLVIQDSNHKSPLNQLDIVSVLEDKRVIPPWLSSNLKERIKYIYTLEYDLLRHISKDELYILLENYVSDFRNFKKYVLEYIK